MLEQNAAVVVVPARTELDNLCAFKRARALAFVQRFAQHPADRPLALTNCSKESYELF